MRATRGVDHARGRELLAAPRTDHIDLYQIHRPEPQTAIDETLGALTDLQRAGKIRYFGSSTFPGWQLEEAAGSPSARAVPLPDRAAPVLDLRAADRARRAPRRATVGMGCSSGVRLAEGGSPGIRRAKRRTAARRPPAAARVAVVGWARYRPESRPEIQRKLDLVGGTGQRRAEAGVIDHPHGGRVPRWCPPAVPRRSSDRRTPGAAGGPAVRAPTFGWILRLLAWRIDELSRRGPLSMRTTGGFDPWWLEADARRR